MSTLQYYITFYLLSLTIGLELANNLKSNNADAGNAGNNDNGNTDYATY